MVTFGEEGRAHMIAFWKMGELSDREVVEGLRARVASSRAQVAEIVAHLGEVEERRLHLRSGCGSMFEYCVKRLGLSEDEACRRIDVARLARRFPAIFPMLASGELSLTVAGLLKPHLVDSNASRLLEALVGCSSTRAREVLAGFFPRPDVPTSIRKLPEPRTVRRSADSACARDAAVRHPMAGEAAARPAASSILAASDVALASPELRLAPSLVGMQPSLLSSISSTPSKIAPEGDGLSSLSAAPPSRRPGPAARLPAPARIEPLAPSRYRLQLTVSASLKQKLELARDLLRHAVPSGDHAVIIERALDLLLDQQHRRRFGAKAATRASVRRVSAAADVTEPSQLTATATVKIPAAPTAAADADADAAAPASNADLEPVTPDVPDGTAATSDIASASDRYFPAGPRSRYISRAVRRIVAERDGLRCSWVGEDGARCEARAWLELDHRCPLGKGGASEAANMRHLCRAHNRLAAELEYGRTLLDRFATGGAR
jgi:hypothetical protein